MTWKEAKRKYHPFKVYFKVLKSDVLKHPFKQTGGIITCLPINQGFSTERHDNTFLHYGFSSLTGPKAYRIAESLDSIGIRYELWVNGVKPWDDGGKNFDFVTEKILDTIHKN